MDKTTRDTLFWILAFHGTNDVLEFIAEFLGQDEDAAKIMAIVKKSRAKYRDAATLKID